MSSGDVEVAQPTNALANEQEQVTLSWDDVSFVTGKAQTQLLHAVSGQVSSGELLAVLGPSGAGKSTFLDVISRRKPVSTGTIALNGDRDFDPAEVMSYVEQDDALLGVLTIDERVDGTLASLGLAGVAENRIGTPIQRGISGGQRRRVTLACSVVVHPRVLILDEVTSGLDSVAAREVISAVKRVAKETKAAVVCTIHQPSYDTLALFDKVTFLAQGRTVFSGAPQEIAPYLSRHLNFDVPSFANPADRMMDLLNQDFESTRGALTPLDFAEKWNQFHPQSKDEHETTSSKASVRGVGLLCKTQLFSLPSVINSLSQTYTLCHRNLLNYSRNLLAFGVRLAMYAGMGLLVATIWLHLPQTDAAINDRLSVLFYGVAFLSFMSVAGIPAFLEERALFLRERRNGLYGPVPFVVANSLVSAPFMLLASLLFTVIAYWAVPLRGGARVWFRFVATLFVSVYIAETQSILIASVVPIFVAALALTAFANGLWMSVQGYFIRLPQMPGFWRSWVHYIDYETWSWQLLVANEFRGVDFSCRTVNDVCSCQFAPASSGSSCAIAGQDVLEVLGIGGTNMGQAFGILIAIMMVYRVLLLLAVTFKRR
ncbi:hypothetical protein OIV83_005578 [Microbotryomycetes sp. JL201]|nr:hypothetical protein OIV83_005578 [Microbotryomycetes sp. JL201]